MDEIKSYHLFIQNLVDRWKTEGEFRSPIKGCLDTDLEAMMTNQNVSYIPARYRELMLFVGIEHGGLLMGSGVEEVRYPYVCSFKTQDNYPDMIVLNETYQLPIDSFVFQTDHDMYALYFRTDQMEDNPVIYRISHPSDSYFDEHGDKAEITSLGRLSDFLTNALETGIREHSIITGRATKDKKE
jgi:hypothetical protein